VDSELDTLLITDLKLKRPDNFFVASGFQGDKGSLTLTFPNLSAILEVLLWNCTDLRHVFFTWLFLIFPETLNNISALENVIGVLRNEVTDNGFSCPTHD
jgi:hypothetical protein